MTMRNVVTVSERSAEAPRAPASGTIKGIIGTGLNIASGVLTNNVPRYFDSMRALVEAITPDSGTVATGIDNTLYHYAVARQGLVSSPVIAVLCANGTGVRPSETQFAAAAQALDAEVDGSLPDIITADGLTDPTAGATADYAVTAVEALCEAIDSVFFYSPGNTGATLSAMRANAIAYVGANGAERGGAIWPRANQTLDDPSGFVSSSLARFDIDHHRGANPVGMRVYGVSGTSPRISTKFSGRGTAADDLQPLLAASIIPLIEKDGVRIYDSLLSGYSPDSTDIYRFFPVRRTADQIVQHVPVIAQPFIEGPENFNPNSPSSIATNFQSYLDSLVAIGQIISGEASVDLERQTAAELANGRVYILISFVPAIKPELITVVVEARSGVVVG